MSERAKITREWAKKSSDVASRISIATDRQLNTAFGVYSIKCLANNRIYVGGTEGNFEKRLREHLSALEDHEHLNRLLRDDWMYFTNIVFVFDILEVCEDKNEVRTREKYWLDLTAQTISSHDKSYNPEVRKAFLQRELKRVVDLYPLRSPASDFNFLLSVMIRVSPEVEFLQCIQALGITRYGKGNLFRELRREIWLESL